MLLQWLAGDFSYLIGNVAENSEIFSRVRGTDYYHAPATFTLVIGGLIFFGFYRAHGHLWQLGIAFALFGVATLNNTRGISLALLAGLFVILISALCKRQWVVTVCALIVICITVPNVFYLKLENDDDNDKTSELNRVYKANSARVLLAKESVKQLKSFPIIGRGVGTLNLKLEGNAFNGLLSTDSSHSLYLDIALMGGIIAFAGFFVAFAVAAFSLLVCGLRQTSRLNKQSCNKYDLSGALVSICCRCSVSSSRTK